MTGNFDARIHTYRNHSFVSINGKRFAFDWSLCNDRNCRIYFPRYIDRALLCCAITWNGINRDAPLSHASFSAIAPYGRRVGARRKYNRGGGDTERRIRQNYILQSHTRSDNKRSVRRRILVNKLVNVWIFFLRTCEHERNRKIKATVK